MTFIAFPQYSVCIFVPAITLSTAYSKLEVSMDLWPSLAACRAASLQMLAMSAPAETKRFHDRHMESKPQQCCVVTSKDVSCLLIKSIEAGRYFLMATDVHRFT